MLGDFNVAIRHSERLDEDIFDHKTAAEFNVLSILIWKILLLKAFGLHDLIREEVLGMLKE